MQGESISALNLVSQYQLMSFFDMMVIWEQQIVSIIRALSRKLELKPSVPNWESERSEHACVSTPKCSWGVWRKGTLSPPPPQRGSQGKFIGSKTPLEWLKIGLNLVKKVIYLLQQFSHIFKTRICRRFTALSSSLKTKLTCM